MLSKISSALLVLVSGLFGASGAIGCGGDDTKAIVPAAPAAVDAPGCVDGGPVTLALTTPATYACMDHFRATLTVTNGSCAAVTVSNIMLSAVVTGSTGNCTAPGDATYPPMVGTVGSKQTVTVLDLTGGQFCCFNMTCPADFTCNETDTFTVNSSAGALTKTADIMLNLQSCTVICPAQ